MELEQLEGLSLPEDRQKTISQLIPGSEEHYFYSCLQQQHQNKLEDAEATLQALINRYGVTSKAQELRARLSLLAYEKAPQKTLAFLRETLSLSFDHQREATEEEQLHPSTLPENTLDRKRLAFKALLKEQNLQGFTDNSLRWLSEYLRNLEQRREFLRRLALPDVPNLLPMIVEELNDSRSGGFGSLSIHYALTLAQLDDLLRLRPALQENLNFIKGCIRKLAPPAGVDLGLDDDERGAYLSRLWGLAGSLLPSFNSLKMHVLYHMLDLDLRHHRYSQDRFSTYLTLPRQTPYMRPEYLKQQGAPIRMGSDDWGTGLARVSDDETLVRSYLEHFFQDADSYDQWTPYLREDYLTELFATTKILGPSQAKDGERWYSMLNSPTKYQALKERIELALAPQNQTTFSESEPIVLEVTLKNVSSLLVRVFEINARNYYTTQKKELDTSLDLDGLVATQEHTYQYDTPPLQKTRQTFRFDDLSRPGVFVIELIGNGKSCRALIFKGALRYIERNSAAGHAFTILSEGGERLQGATLWLGGREYHANAAGEIFLPYSTNPGRVQLLLCHQEVVTLASFEHQGERYNFSAGLFLEREQLLPRKTARLLWRPCLKINQVPMSLSVIERPLLIIETVDRHGVSSRLESPITLSSEEEGSHTFQVPEDLLTVTCTMRGVVRSLTEQREISLEDQTTLTLNEIDNTAQIEDLHLSLCASGYVLSLLGKTGEPRPNVVLTLSLYHQDLTQPIEQLLQTDTEGRVTLGDLPGITRLSARTPSGFTRVWSIHRERPSYPNTVHGPTYEAIRLPYAGRHQSITQEGFSLFEKRGDTFVKDCLDSLQLKEGQLVIEGLHSGEYELWLHEYSTKISITTVSGVWCNGWVVGARQALEAQSPPSLFITKAALEDEELMLQLEGATEDTRVHLLTTRFLPDGRASAYLGRPLWSNGRRTSTAPKRSFYVSGREIGDEYRYVLERKQAKKFPGNTLERPGLLLNPWDIRTTTTGREMAKEGGAFAASGMGAAAAFAGPETPWMSGGGGALAGSSNLDFLPDASVVLHNLRPDAQGALRIKRSQLGAHTNQVRVFAVNSAHAVERWVLLPEAKMPNRDLRVKAGLDPAQHFLEQTQSVTLHPNETLTLQDLTTSSVERYDTLASVYRLLLSISSNATLPEFSFVLEWPKLDQATKRARYSEWSCHELNLFLYCKDRAFFDAVIAPYLKNKKHKTFLDRYLLAEDLSEYNAPRAFGRLNVVEQILLSRRLAADDGEIARSIKESVESSPQDPAREEHLLRAALKSGALEATEISDAMETLSMEPAPMMLDEAAFGGPPATGGLIGGEREEAVVMRSLRMNAPAPRPAAPMKKPRVTQDLDARAESRAHFRAVDKTKERAENNYYKLRPNEQTASLVTANAFWRDFAAHDPKAPFFSSNFLYATTNFTEMMCALAVLDLPFEAPKPELSFEGRKMTLRAASDAIVFYREITAAKHTNPSPLLVSQEYFRADDRYTHEGNEQVEKPVREFLVQVVYVCKVVLTNPTSSRQKLSVLLQIPWGSMPVNGGVITKSQQLRLGAYATQTIEYSFYFPKAGEFPHFPVHAAHNVQHEERLASAPARVLSVLQKATQIDASSWPHLSQHGEPQAVLEALARENLARLDLQKIAWRLREKPFFLGVIAILSKRHAYHRTVWSYGVLHEEPAIIRELLSNEEGLIRLCGKALRSPLLDIDPVLHSNYEHLEYSPLINARAHRLSAKLKILNEAMAAQYRQLLTVLSYQDKPTHEQLLSAVYYQLLQDRIDDALALFARVDPTQITERLQYDYLSLYIALYTEEHEKAKQLAGSYATYPVDKWRRLFESAVVFFEEATGSAGQATNKDDRNQRQDLLASQEPSFEVEVTGESLQLRYQNLTSCQLNFYLMDIELLFSRQPFLQQASDRFSMIKPNHSQTLTLDAAKPAVVVEIPEAMRGKNVVIEVTGAGLRKAQVRYSHQLSVQVIEPYGQLRVRQQSKQTPLSRCYAKVYAKKHDGAVEFYKDGYTDLRGLFDYASLSTNELDSVQRFAILLFSDDFGAMITEANPPTR